MGIWLEILESAANGDSATARLRMWEELPEALRHYGPSGDGTRECRGPLPRAIRKFFSRLPSSVRGRAGLYAEDLAEYVVETLVDQVDRSIRLVEICRERPAISLDELVTLFPWPAGLKRDAAWKRAWLANMLCSMREAGVPVETTIDGGEPKYRFEEMAYALSSRRIDQSWNDFKRRNDLGSEYLSIVDGETDDGVAEEGADYGSVTVARLVLATVYVEAPETALDLARLSAALSEEIAATLERMHAEGPADGYRPIAWHCVYWIVRDDYEVLSLTLDTRAPFCEIAQELADHIAAAYPDVEKTSRPTIHRRRARLHGECKRLVLSQARDLVRAHA